jgi:hypothetical protein
VQGMRQRGGTAGSICALMREVHARAVSVQEPAEEARGRQVTGTCLKPAPGTWRRSQEGSCSCKAQGLIQDICIVDWLSLS